MKEQPFGQGEAGPPRPAEPRADLLGAHQALTEQYQDFVRRVSHDLRTPLMPLVLHAQMLLRGIAPEDRNRKHATAIVENAQRISDMIKDLVEMVRMETGQLKLLCCRFDLAALLGDLTQRAAALPGVERVLLSLGAPEMPVEADPRLLERALRLLVAHALQHSAPGTPVALGALWSAGQVELTITQRGPGLAPDEVALLFQRAPDASGKASRELSVYLALLIIQAHDGFLAVDNAPGEGCTYRILLPSRASAAAPEPGTGAVSP